MGVLLEETKTSYCDVCNGCGEEGCCSPIKCTQSPDGKYCQTYLKDLKFGYTMSLELLELIKNDPKYKDEIDKIFDKTYGKIYNNEK